MSAPAAPPVAPPGGGPGAPAPPPVAKRRSGVLVGVFVLLAVAVVSALALAAVIAGGTREQPAKGNSVSGDPGNFGGDGTAALAETLKTHGVAVRVARNQDELRGLGVADAATVVVISQGTRTSKSSSAIVRDRSRTARRIVILDPRSEVLAEWGIDIGFVGSPYTPTELRAQCSAAGIAPTDRAAHASPTVVPGPAEHATQCFRSGSAPDSAPVVVFPATASRPEIVVAPQDWFVNRAILENDQAGIAVRLIGAGAKVDWFAADYGDLSNDQPKSKPSPSLKPDVPRWLWPMIGLGWFVLFALMLWRGRRFGQLITEPLPAVVKAAETTEARGRLYQASGDAARAAAQLRRHALRTIPRRLGVSRHAPVDDIVAAVSRATGRDHGTVLALLVGPLPADNAGLVRFATDLSTLEEEVRPVL